MASFRTKIGAFLAKPAFSGIKKMLDPSEIGAAPLLGIDALVYVGHGRSDTKAVVSSIRAAKEAVDKQLLTKLRHAIAENMPE
jgi:glycerol-3-phosphate acyltransferase PlsX